MHSQSGVAWKKTRKKEKDGSWGKYLATATDSGQLWEPQMWLFVKEAGEEEDERLVAFIRTESKQICFRCRRFWNAALKNAPCARGGKNGASPDSSHYEHDAVPRPCSVFAPAVVTSSPAWLHGRRLQHFLLFVCL